MWMYTGILIGLTMGIIFRKRIVVAHSVLVTTLPIFLDAWVKKKARKLNLISGEKIIDAVTDTATITYQNSRGRPCMFKTPFYRKNVREMKDKKVILFTDASRDWESLIAEGLTRSRSTDYNQQLSTVLKREEGTFIRYDITQEPGLPYLLSPNQLGGTKICVYHAGEGKTWADEFLLDGEPLLTVQGDEKLPTFFTFSLQEKEEDEILF